MKAAIKMQKVQKKRDRQPNITVVSVRGGFLTNYKRSALQQNYAFFFNCQMCMVNFLRTLTGPLHTHIFTTCLQFARVSSYPRIRIAKPLQSCVVHCEVLALSVSGQGKCYLWLPKKTNNLPTKCYTINNFRCKAACSLQSSFVQ